MKIPDNLKKSSFINGALFVTICIIITKILGVLYVIPFHAMIGESGGALYGYAYTIYVFFLSLSSAGIPLAISKIISEYNTSGNYDARDRAFYLGKRISLIFGVVVFLILNIFAGVFASIIIGDVSGGNTVEDVTTVIRVISTAILVVPILSIYRGFYQGYRFMEPPSISQVIEQVVRISVIILGSLLSLKVFKLSLTTTVGVAVFAATIGAISAYFYLFTKYKNNKSRFKNTVPKIKIPVTDKEIIRKIFYYAFPLIMIDLSKSVYNFIDTFMVLNGLVDHANYVVEDAEVVVSMLSTWASKFNMVVSAVASGIVVSLIPNLTSSIVKKDKEDISLKVNDSIGLCLLLTVPMTFGIAFLSKPIWCVFYGSSDVGQQLLGFFIFTGLLSSVFTVLVTIIQLFKDYKVLFNSLFVGVIIKLLFNVNMIGAFYREGLPPYYGVITATLFGYFVSIVYCFIYLGIKRNINFEKLISVFFDILCGSFLMIVVLLIINLIIPFNTTSRVLNFLFIMLYAVVGMVVYFIYTYKMKTLDKLLGKNFINKLLK